MIDKWAMFGQLVLRRSPATLVDSLIHDLRMSEKETSLFMLPSLPPPDALALQQQESFAGQACNRPEKDAVFRFLFVFPTGPPSVSVSSWVADRSNELIDHHDADDQCGKGLGPCTLEAVLHLDTREEHRKTACHWAVFPNPVKFQLMICW